MPSVGGVPGAKECTQFLINNFEFKNILDLGCGYMPYINLFNTKNIKYTGIDAFDPKIINKHKKSNAELINANFADYDFKGRKFDCVYSSHVIEHVADTEWFIRLLSNLVNDNGHLCIIFPKPKPEVVGGHVHIFNPGIMYYNIIRTGIDCSQWKTVEKDYSFGLMGPCKKVPQPKLTYSAGEIESLAKYFPFPARQGFHGVTATNIQSI